MTNNKKKIKISDFGIATQTENNLSGKRTLVGTPWFMAPEVINEEAYSNKVSFIWKFSFGLIFIFQRPISGHLAAAAFISCLGKSLISAQLQYR